MYDVFLLKILKPYGEEEKEDKYYLPRDISWMYFNRRILQEAMKERVPILERLSFLGIYSNNLDEFSEYV